MKAVTFLKPIRIILMVLAFGVVILDLLEVDYGLRYRFLSKDWINFHFRNYFLFEALYWQAKFHELTKEVKR